MATHAPQAGRSRLRLYAYFAVLAALGLWPGSALAHAELVAAEPAPGSRVAPSPRQIRLTFGQAIRPESRLTVYGPGFREIPSTSISIGADSPTELVASIPDLEPGEYTVQWTAVSDDGHESSGSYSFGVEASGASGLAAGQWAAILAGVVVVVLVGWYLRRQARPRRGG